MDRDSEKSEKLRLSIEAKRILSDPMISGFLEDSEKMAFDAFTNMPIGATLAEYQVVHHDLMAIRRFKARMLQYIAEYNQMAMMDRRMVADGV